MSNLQFQMWNSNSATQPYYWRIVSVLNGKVLATSETYARKADAEHAINLVFSNAASATYLDKTK